MAADLGKASARQDEGLPRPRGGAHAASKNVRLRRGASGPVPPPALPSPRRTVPGGTVAALAALAARLEPAATRGPVDRLAAARPGPVRPAVAGLVAAAVVVTVIPLVLVQVPDAIAWSLPARFAHGGPNTLASVLRAAGLALPVMAVAAPFGALATRRFRPRRCCWPGCLP